MLGESSNAYQKRVVLKSFCKGLIIDRNFICHAHKEWRAGGSGRKNAWRVVDEYGSEDALIDEIFIEITDRNLSFEPIRRYGHQEPSNGKRRLIGVESVKQQVVDYAAIAALFPLIKMKLGFYQVSSVPGKGQCFAAKTVKKWSKDNKYWVHLDIKKCYPSLLHKRVYSILEKYVKNSTVLYICRALFETYKDGLEIGSFFSLVMAQLMLSFCYHYIEGFHKIRRGKNKKLVNHQMWYLDDIWLFSNDKRDLRISIKRIEDFLYNELGLHIKSWKICRVGSQEPINIVGYVVRPHSITIKDGIFIRAKRAFRRYLKNRTPRMARRVCSFYGWFKNSDVSVVLMPLIKKASSQVSQLVI